MYLILFPHYLFLVPFPSFQTLSSSQQGPSFFHVCACMCVPLHLIASMSTSWRVLTRAKVITGDFTAEEYDSPSPCNYYLPVAA